MSRIRVLIADDHSILRAGLALMIRSQADLELVGQAGTVRELLSEARRLTPDVICLDLDFPDGSGLKAVAPLRTSCPATKILVVSAHDETAYVHAAMAEGVNGFVAKTVAEAELFGAIRAVAGNRVVVILDKYDDPLGKVPSEAKASGLDRLSAREREVLGLLAFGFTNQQAADRLYLSVKTVETHRARLAAKLGLRDRADLIRYAIEMGLMSKGSARADEPPEGG